MGVCSSKSDEKVEVSEEAMLAKRTQAAIRAKKTQAALRLKRNAPDPEFVRAVGSALRGNVRMFSGCMDSQTSADVKDVSSFGLPPVSDAEKAGGACTNSILSALKRHPKLTFAKLLISMRKTLQHRGYKQIPQLSSSFPIKLDEKFSVWNPICEKLGKGRNKSLLIGINYTGHSSGVLNGCVNDALMMRDFLISQGYSSEPACMQLLADDSSVSDIMPTGENIVKAMAKLVANVKEGDSLFLHYSGHGSQVPDKTGDEKDGKDETIVPVDFKENGQITDDTLFQLLVASLPEGVTLTCVFDCCHSGTILDLPYVFSATKEGCDAIKAGEKLQTQPNPGFSIEYAQQLVSSYGKGMFNQILKNKFAGGGGVGEGIKNALMNLVMN